MFQKFDRLAHLQLMLLGVVFVHDQVIRIRGRLALDYTKSAAEIAKFVYVNAVQCGEDLGSAQRHNQNTNGLRDVRLLAQEWYKFFIYLARRNREGCTRLQPDISPGAFRALSRVLQQTSTQANQGENRHHLHANNERTQERTDPSVFQVLKNQLVNHRVSNCRLMSWLRLKKISRYSFHGLVIDLHATVQCAHSFGVDVIGKHGQGQFDIRPLIDETLPQDEARIVRRKRLAVVLKDRESRIRQRGIGRICRSHVNVVRLQGTVKQAKIHALRRSLPTKVIDLIQFTKAIGSGQKLVADT